MKILQVSKLIITDATKCFVAFSIIRTFLFVKNEVKKYPYLKVVNRYKMVGIYQYPYLKVVYRHKMVGIRDGIWRVNARHGSIYSSNTAKILPKPSKSGLE